MSALVVCHKCEKLNRVAPKKAAAGELGSQISFSNVNTEKFPVVSQSFKIRGIPTLIVFKNSKEVDRQLGAPLPLMLKESLSTFEVTYSQVI